MNLWHKLALFLGLTSFSLISFGYPSGGSNKCSKVKKQSYDSGYSDGSKYGWDKGYKSGWDKAKQQCKNSSAKSYKSGYDVGYKKGQVSGQSDGYKEGYKAGKGEYDEAYSTGYDAGYEKAQSDYEEPTDPYDPEPVVSYCAYIFKWNGEVTTSQKACSESLQCDDNNRNTVDLCVVVLAE